jgi:large subunit ribosomal protein L10
VLTRAQKEEQVAELKEKFSRAKSVYVADYRGLDVKSVGALRQRIRSEGNGDFEYRVAKNSVLKLATVDSDMVGIAPHFEGPTAVAFSFGDPVGLAKILSDFAKDHEVFEIKGGIVDGSVVGPDQIAELALLPSLDGVRGKLIGLLQASATQLARLLAEPGAQVARLVDARARQEAGGA